jgi:23S rRNA pseudouridine1911/1915/1917 synthase
MAAPPHQLVILLEDNHCLALAKPAALATQAPPGAPSLEALAKAYLKEKYGKPGNVYLGVPHRLDRPVSGVVLFARNSKAAARLAEQFEERQVTKIYWALLEGAVTPPEGRWEDWIAKVEDEARATIATADAPDAQFATLRYRVRQPIGDRSLVEIELETGRMHQIRVQAASRGWPVAGDALYGAVSSFGPPAELPRDRVIALHARSLTFLHPLRYEPVTLTAELPPYWEQ